MRRDWRGEQVNGNSEADEQREVEIAADKALLAAYDKARAERDRYKAALERIRDLDHAEPHWQVAEEALKNE
jgi:hypothetical protein